MHNNDMRSNDRDSGAPIPMPDRLSKLDISRSPGQNRDVATRAKTGTMAAPLDFSHGAVDAFPPVPAAQDAFLAGVAEGGRTAYTRYRGSDAVRQRLAGRLSELTGAPVDPDRELILTPGTQAGLFLSLSSLVERGDTVGLVEPDYFANRRILHYLGAELAPIRLDLSDPTHRNVMDIGELKATLLSQTAKVFCLSNPNNPSGFVLPPSVVHELAQMCLEDDVFVVIDQLYCRQVFSGESYTHLRGIPGMRDRCLTLLGPSKTESLSGYRVGAAVGPDWLIDRMEAILSIISLRAAGYNQRVLDSWLTEDPGWLTDRVNAHEEIRDKIVVALRELPGVQVHPAQGGSYLFVRLPRLDISIPQFISELGQREGIVVTPGAQFGPGYEDCFRINFSQDSEAAIRTVERLVSLAASRLAS